MERLFDNLYAVAAERLSFAPAFTGRAFLLRRSVGNILIYSSGRIAEEADALLAQGGIARHYLNHQHQAIPTCNWVSERFGAKLFVPELEMHAIAEVCHVGGTFKRRELPFPDFEVIPIPGHTVGSACFLWNDGERRYLFTGDTIYLKDDIWTAAVLGSSDRTAYIQSLSLVRELDFDVLVPSMACGAAVQLTDARGIRRCVDAIIERLARGQDQ